MILINKIFIKTRFFYRYYYFMYCVHEWGGENIPIKISAPLCQPFADLIRSTLIMTEEAGRDGFRLGFIPLPASRLHNAFLDPSQKPLSQTSLFITQPITILHCFVRPSPFKIEFNSTPHPGVTFASGGRTREAECKNSGNDEKIQKMLSL